MPCLKTFQITKGLVKVIIFFLNGEKKWWREDGRWRMDDGDWMMDDGVKSAECIVHGA
jgi:hypothetical protein